MKVNYRFKCFRFVSPLQELILLYHVYDIVLLDRYHRSCVWLLRCQVRCNGRLLWLLLGLEQLGVRQKVWVPIV